MLLYDEAGLRIFEEITYLSEYYLTNEEINVLTTWSDQIASKIKPGSIVVELGSGNLRKVDILLSALDRTGHSYDYYALDLNYDELVRTLSKIPKGRYTNVTCHGLFGTYDDGLVWLTESQNQARPKTIMSLGSSIGNFTREEAYGFLKNFASQTLRSADSGDRLLIGIDNCKEPDKVWHAYNDSEGVTERFIMNGLVHANLVLDRQVFNLDDWEYVGEFDAEAGRHQAFYSPKVDVQFNEKIKFQRGERIRVEESYKFSNEEVKELWRQAQVVEKTSWGSKSGDYHIYMVARP